jgi:hypothetical protein
MLVLLSPITLLASLTTPPAPIVSVPPIEPVPMLTVPTVAALELTSGPFDSPEFTFAVSAVPGAPPVPVPPGQFAPFVQSPPLGPIHVAVAAIAGAGNASVPSTAPKANHVARRQIILDAANCCFFYSKWPCIYFMINGIIYKKQSNNAIAERHEEILIVAMLMRHPRCQGNRRPSDAAGHSADFGAYAGKHCWPLDAASPA